MPVAYVLINTEIGAEREVLKALRNVEGVKEAFNLSGIYDIIARVEAGNMESLNRIISEKIQLERVHSKLTVVVSDSLPLQS